MSEKQRILILCTGNSARSQMAEGWLHAQGADRVFEVFSAGTRPAARVHPGAIAVMREIGIDISHHTPKSVDQFVGLSFDTVITVCDSANEECPIFPGVGQRIHHSFTDPAAAPEDQQLDVFRRVRNDIANWLTDLFNLKAPIL